MKNPKAKTSQMASKKDVRFDTSNNPRFLKLPNSKKKIKTDNRFTKFSETFSQKKTRIDAFGRPYNPSKENIEFNKELSKFYYTEKDDLTPAATHNFDTKENSYELQLSENESEEYSITTTDDEDSDTDSELEESTKIWDTYHDDIPKGNATSRLAIMGCEWHYINAVDILALLQSFNTPIQHINNDHLSSSTYVKGIKKVAIYPSDYGLSQIEKENVQGPLLDDDKSSGISIPKDFSFENNIDSKDQDEELELNKIYKSTDQELSENQEKMRNYQYMRSFYYYAIIDCNSLDEATKLYDELDGLETEIALNGLDLRFVPENLTPPHSPISEATEIPSNYEPPIVLGRSALRHSKVKCTWDEPESQRTKFFMKKFSPKELEQMDVEAFIGSEDDFGSEDEEDESQFYKVDEKNLKEYRKALLGENVDDELNDNSKTGHKFNETRSSNDFHVKFSSSLKSLTLAKDSSDPKLEAPEDDLTAPMKKKKSKGNSSDPTIEDQNELADLELITMNTNPDRHFDLTETLQKTKKNKNGKNKKQMSTSLPEDDFKIDIKDPRFSNLFSRSDYAIDPTHPQFRKTASNATILSVKRKQTKESRTFKASTSSLSTSKPNKFVPKNHNHSPNCNDPPLEHIRDIVLVKKRKTLPIK